MVFSERQTVTGKVEEWLRRTGRDYDPAVVFNVVTAVNATGAMVDPTALVHLRALVESGWECEKGPLQDKECFHCGGEFYYDGPGSGHKPDCRYLVAKAFVEGLEGTRPGVYVAQGVVDGRRVRDELIGVSASPSWPPVRARPAESLICISSIDLVTEPTPAIECGPTRMVHTSERPRWSIT